MKFVALISGGKDSIFSIMECVSHGHELTAVANLSPPFDASNYALEIDSYMYQSVGNEGIKTIAKVLNVPLYQKKITGVVKCTTLTYRECKGDEVEDLYLLLHEVLTEHPDIEAVSSGAILSDYQRTRVEHVAFRLGLQSLAFLWNQNQQKLLRDMIDASIHAIIIKVASFGLKIERDLGMDLKTIYPRLCELANSPYFLNPCGEGGEFETFTLDCPLYTERIGYRHSSVKVLSDTDLDSVAHLQLGEFFTEPKPLHLICNKPSDILAIKTPDEDSYHPFKDPIERLTANSSTFYELVLQEFLTDLSLTSENVSNSFANYNNNSGDLDVQNNNCFLFPGCFLTKHFLGYSASMNSLTETIKHAFNMSFDQLRDHLENISPNRMYRIEHITLIVNRPLTDAFLKVLNQIYAISLSIQNDASPPPSCVLIGQKDLQSSTKTEAANEDLIFSLSAIYVQPCEVNGMDLHSRNGLFTTSISHWIPPSLGPYSQLVNICIENQPTFTCYSGQIGLVPELVSLPGDVTMTNVKSIDELLRMECLLSLRHCHRLIKKNCPDLWKNVSLLICYATTHQTLSISHDYFHRSVCLNMHKCICQTSCIWVEVSYLPKNANIQWQLFTTQINYEFQNNSLLLIINDPPNPPDIKHVCMIFIQSFQNSTTDSDRLKLNMYETKSIVSVNRFLDQEVNMVYVCQN